MVKPKASLERADSKASNVSSSSSGSTAVSSVSAGNYAPSPNTCDQALNRANQRRVQALIRQLLASDDSQKLYSMRLLRKLLRELDFQISWLAQVDLLEAIERLLREETQKDTDWRLLNDSTQLLTEAVPRLPMEPDWDSLERIVICVIENLGHQKSEIRRSSLLFINYCIHHYNKRPIEYRRLMHLFIEKGLANQTNEQAQRGAILSLPLLMSKQAVDGHDMLPIISCLSDLLVGAHSRLFYSLYLALQRFHQILGDKQFAFYLDQCQTEARILYKQAASRTNSIVSTTNESFSCKCKESSDIKIEGNHSPQCEPSVPSSSRQVTFDTNTSCINSEDHVNRRQSITDSSRRASKHETDLDSVKDITKQDDFEEKRKTSSLSELSGSEDQAPFWQTNSNGTECQESKPMKGPSFSSDVSSTCSSDAHLVNPAHYMNEPALNGHPLDGLLSLPPHHLDHDDNLAINQIGVCCSPTVEVGSNSKNELRFGIFPRHLVQVALSPSSSSKHQQQDRLDALNEMMCTIRDSPINHLAILVTYLDPFIDQFLSRLIEPSVDVKSGLVALDMIETIVIKTKLSTLQFVRPITQILVRALADSRSLYRDNTIRVIHKMMAYLPPQHVIDALFEHKHHRNPIVREQLVDRVTGAVLNYDRQEFNLTKLCYHVLPMLADHHANVRLAALECIASLAHALGPERIGTLLTAAEAVQTGCDYDGLLDGIYARLKRKALPRCNSDGSIRYVIRPFLSSTHAQFHQEHGTADVRWVMEAPSSHQHLHENHNSSSQAHHDHKNMNEHHVHAHRPGVYSPTVAAEMSRARRLSLSREPEKCHSHHHAMHPHHNVGECSHGDQTRANPADRSTDAGTCEPPVGTSRRPSEPSKLEDARIGRGRDSISVKKSGSEASEYMDDLNSCSAKTATKSGQVKVRNRSKSECRPGPKRLPATEVSRKEKRFVNKTENFRCESRESASSNDSDKVLFQYYLTKFKQSLISQSNNGYNSMSVLPSDSIIYTDSAQNLASVRQRSRHQQTSFDYGSDSVGQTPIGRSTSLMQQDEHINGEPTNRQDAQRSDFKQEQSHQVKERTDSDPLGSIPSRRSSSSRSMSKASIRRQQSVIEEDRSRKAKEEHLNRKVYSEAELLEQKLSDEQQNIKAQKEENHSGKLKVTSQNIGVSDDEEINHIRDQNEGQLNSANEREPENESQRGVDREKYVTNSSQADRRGSSSAAGTNRPAASMQEFSKGSEGHRDVELDSAELKEAHRSNMVANELGREDEGQDLESIRTREGRPRRRSHFRTKERDSAASESGSGSSELRQRMARSQPPRRDRQTDQDSNQPSHSTRLSKTHSKPSHSDPFEASDSSSASAGECARRALSVSPGCIGGSVNIRHILENVADVEGPFQEPQLAFRVSMDALNGNCWSTKVEGILALIRLASHHPQILVGHQHELVRGVSEETKNLRSTVSRSAIFALGEFCAKLGRSIESELDTIVQSLLYKSVENTAFIRDDIRRALSTMIEHITHWKLATALMNHGANHKNLHVRRMASQFLATLVQRMGPAKCLVGAKDISAQLLPAAAKFAQDGSPQTRYYGRLILATTMQHGAFDRLMRKSLSPSLYRGSIGVIENIKRRGAGELPTD